MTNAQGFKPGDIVQLRSGGPLLTVAWTNDDGSIGCQWWNETASKFEFERMNAATLEPGGD